MPTRSRRACRATRSESRSRTAASSRTSSARTARRSLSTRPSRTSTSPFATGAGANRARVQVADNSPFVVGETVVISATGATTQEATIAEKQGAKTLVLEAAVPGTDDFAERVGPLDRPAARPEGDPGRPPDWIPGSGRGLPHGATVRIDDGAAIRTCRTVDSTASSGTSGGSCSPMALKRTYDLDASHPTVASLEFDLVVRAAQEPRAPFPRLSMHPDHPNYWGSAVDLRLGQLREPDQPPAQPDPDPRPKVEHEEPDRAAPTTTGQGVVGPRDARRATRLEARRRGRGRHRLRSRARRRRDARRVIVDTASRRARFAILDSVPKIDPTKIVSDQADKVRSDERASPRSTTRGSGWLNPRTGRTEYWPPSGHVAGLYARTDTRAGVHAAPANTRTRRARARDAAQRPRAGPTEPARAVNVLRDLPGRGPARSSGAHGRPGSRTSTGSTSASVDSSSFSRSRSSRTSAGRSFSRTTSTLWQQLRRVISDFLTTVWQDGALFGATAKEAFYVRIDEALNPESERALGRLHIEIGVAPDLSRRSSSSSGSGSGRAARRSPRRRKGASMHGPDRRTARPATPTSTSSSRSTGSRGRPSTSAAASTRRST